MDDPTRTEEEIRKAEQHEALKQTLLRLLDDPQIQRRIVALLQQSAWARSKGIARHEGSRN
jgi:hypothetical protein